MIEGIRHTGLVVRDISRSKSFWIDIMGFSLINEMKESGPHIDNMIGLKNIEVLTAKLSSKDGKILELLEFKSHAQDSYNKMKPYSLGFTHIALNVKNLNNMISALKANNFSFPGEPQLSLDKKVSVIYAYGEDNIILELVETH
jgi:catechol 2,3-dioxygenase-like lactoylglutathione lyase family enzyme